MSGELEQLPYDDTTIDHIPISDIVVSDIALWTGPESLRDKAFARLRAERPVSFHPEADIPGFPLGPGFWAVTRFDDVWEVSRHPKLFQSGLGSNIFDLPVEINEFFGSMINMDDPKHVRLRSIVQKAFTPRQIALIDDHVRDVAARVVDRLLADHLDGRCDFVTEVAAQLPLEIICQMMGIPTSDVERIFGWTNAILGASDPDYGGTFEQLLATSLEFFAYAQSLGEQRLEAPADDLTSALMHASVDGERLSAAEFGSFFILLSVAGNETTRNAISHGMLQLTRHPEQRALWWSDFDRFAPGAVEEIVRWASPVTHFRRTATEDTVLNATPIAAGDKVVMFYTSANRDERHFERPYEFDITRTPNDHVGFGAGGPHFCLGANLARREITAMFDELHRRVPDIAIVGEPARLRSMFINGIKRMPCAWSTT
ncbi:MAG: cytochrome P450 [Acidimicrobiia bacterium]